MSNNTRIKIYLPLFLLTFALIFSLIMALVWGEGDGFRVWLDLLPGTLLKVAVVGIIVEGVLFYLLKTEVPEPDPVNEGAKEPGKTEAE
ncbi:hypothetical protein [Emcibacter sp.]|uniref:hypothetical protein n=1 Tax=Emcibacter sp. TaxID=1979954 RepID=UPI002AA778EA|nr:hypothetical protein [Emcibacter sp.]